MFHTQWANIGFNKVIFFTIPSQLKCLYLFYDIDWSAPSAIGIAGLGGGFEIGAEVSIHKHCFLQFTMRTHFFSQQNKNICNLNIWSAVAQLVDR